MYYFCNSLLPTLDRSDLVDYLHFWVVSERFLYPHQTSTCFCVGSYRVCLTKTLSGDNVYAITPLGLMHCSCEHQVMHLDIDVLDCTIHSCWHFEHVILVETNSILLTYVLEQGITIKSICSLQICFRNRQNYVLCQIYILHIIF